MIALSKKHVSFLSAELSFGMPAGSLLQNFHTMGEECAGQFVAEEAPLCDEDVLALAVEMVSQELVECRIDSAECTAQAVAAFVAGYRSTVAEAAHDA